MQIIFRRSIAAILGSLGFRTDADTYEYISILAEAFLVDTATDLHKITRVQRRALPALTDVALLLKEDHIQLHDLERHIGLKSRFTDALDNLRFNPEEEPVPEGAQVFFHEVSTTKRLMPPTKHLDAVPSWMPEFPPDHTFMATPQYASRITDPRQLREKVVEEGRLAEAALRRLTGIVKVDEALAEDEDEEMRNAEDDELVEVEFDDYEDANGQGGSRMPSESEAPGTRGHSDAELESSESEDEMKLEKFTTPTFRPIETVDAANGGGGSAPLSPHTVKPFEPDSHEPKPKSKPRLSLKLTLNKKEPKITVITKTEEEKPAADARTTTTMTTAERNKYDPFGIKTTSKRFDVAAYAKKQIEIRAKREIKKQRLNEERQEAVANAQPREAATSQQMVDREYNAAFASIQRKKGQPDSKVLDTGVINWDKVRYVL
ncbi:hypothetical protein TRVA0_022S01332 [Trichomonascus vanleenenianus]|uniref:Taf8p n=1 Tax=Trichomonascus vanleenenianus TaxID=2268995 RepID=UPI003ECB13E9